MIVWKDGGTGRPEFVCPIHGGDFVEAFDSEAGLERWSCSVRGDDCPSAQNICGGEYGCGLPWIADDLHRYCFD